MKKALCLLVAVSLVAVLASAALADWDIKAEFDKAIASFSKRERRMGGRLK